MSGCDDALDAMSTLSHAFKTKEYEDFLGRYARSVAEDGSFYDPDLDEIVRKPRDVRDIVDNIRGAIFNVEIAEPVWVSADVVDLVAWAATPDAKFEPVPIQPHDIWSPHAFCVLEKPMSIIDVSGIRMGYRAIAWSFLNRQPDSPPHGVLVSLWAHADDTDGYEHLTGGRVGYIGGSPYSLAHVGMIPFGEGGFIEHESMRHAIGQFECLWRFAQETIVVPASERPTRHARKRAIRYLRPVDNVTVLRLRRIKRVGGPEGESPEQREISQRHIRRGHWRNQWYPSMGPSYDPAAHKPKWINQIIVRADLPGEIRKPGTRVDR